MAKTSSLFKKGGLWSTTWPVVPPISTETTPTPTQTTGDVTVEGTLTFGTEEDLEAALRSFDATTITESFSSQDFQRDGRVLSARIRTDVAADFPTESILGGFRAMTSIAATGALDVRIGAVISYFHLTPEGQDLGFPPLPPGAIVRYGPTSEYAHDYGGREVVWLLRGRRRCAFDKDGWEQLAGEFSGDNPAVSPSGRYAACLEFDDSKPGHATLSIIESRGERTDIEVRYRGYGLNLYVSNHGHVVFEDHGRVRGFGFDGRLTFTYKDRMTGIVMGEADTFVAEVDGKPCQVDLGTGAITKLKGEGEPFFVQGKLAWRQGGTIRVGTDTTELVLSSRERPEHEGELWVIPSMGERWNADGLPLHDIFATVAAREGSLLLSANLRYNELLLRNWETHQVLLRGRLDDKPDGLFLHREQVVAIVKGKLLVCDPQTGQWLTSKSLKAKHGYVRNDGAFVSLHGDGSVRAWSSLGEGASEPSVLETGLKRVRCIAGDEDGFAVLAGSKVHCLGSDGSERWSAPVAAKERVLGVSNDRVAIAKKTGFQLLNRDNGSEVGSPLPNIRCYATDGSRWFLGSYKGIAVADKGGNQTAWLQGVSQPVVLDCTDSVLVVGGQTVLLFDMDAVDEMGGHPQDDWLLGA